MYEEDMTENITEDITEDKYSLIKNNHMGTDTGKILVQPRLFKVFKRFFKTLLFYAKSIFITYSLYKPELKLGGCVLKFVSLQYPGLASVLTIQNMFNVVSNMFRATVGSMRDAYNENLENNLKLENRIGTKLEQMTIEDFFNYNNVATNPLIDYNTKRMFVLGPDDKQKDFNKYLHQYGVKNIRRKSKELPQSSNNNQKPQAYNYGKPITYKRQTRQNQYSLDDVSLGQTNSLNVNQYPDTSPDRTYEEMIMEGLGYNINNMKGFSIVQCGQKYAFSLFWRYLHSLLTS